MSCAFTASDVRTMVMFGNGEDANPWVEDSSAADVTRFVLFPAAQYGQVGTLKKFIGKGDLQLVDNTQGYFGWNLYHYAIKGYQMNCNYLVSSVTSLDSDHMPMLPATLEEARETQLDVIHALAEGGALPFNPTKEGESVDDHILKLYPPHPSKLALDNEYNFLEAAYLIDILVKLRSDPNTTITPGLDLIKMSENKQYRLALDPLMKWSYYRGYLDILGYCHDRYMSICSDTLRLQQGNIPMILHAISSSKLNVVQLVFDHEVKRPVPELLMSKLYQIGCEDPMREANAVSIACDMNLRGNVHIMDNLIHHKVIGNNLLTISLSELGLEAVPLALFHERLDSLSLRGNKLAQLPPVDEWKCKSLRFLSLEKNLLQVLPPALFNLPKLSTLNASHNQIAHLEESMWSAPLLKKLHLNKNCLTSLPLPELPKMQVNHVIQEDEEVCKLDVQESCELFSISHGFVNCEAQRDNDQSGDGYNLTLLELSDNRLIEVPHGLSCLAPNLRTLKLGRNRISDFGSITAYPCGLKVLDLVENEAQHCITAPSVRISTSRCFQSTSKSLIVCSHRMHTSLPHLEHLNLRKNKLNFLVLEVQGPRKSSSSFPESCLPSTNPLFPNLQFLSFSENCLKAVPDGIHKLKYLRNLDISMNEEITHLPLKIYQLKDLNGFQYKGIADPIIHQLENCKGIGHILHYLRARETDALPNVNMRLSIIGHSKKGKSTVFKAIQNRTDKKQDSPTAEQESTTAKCQCLRYTNWVCTRKKLPSGQFMSFCVWEFGGLNELYPVHQCFLTNRALYLLVWKVTDRDSGIKGLGIWLRNLQSKAPGSKVIVVGSQVDMLPKSEREKVLKSCRQMILNEYGDPPDRAFPEIKHVCFVGFNRSANRRYDELIDMIFDEATMMEIPRTPDMPRNFHMKFLEEMIPKSYIELEKTVVHIRDLYNINIMERSEFCDCGVIKRLIDDSSEVDTAMDTLHNRGTVLHFHMTMLEDYYILNPQWWFDVCSFIVCPENISYLTVAGDRSSGLLSYENMIHLLRKKGIEEYTSIIFQFLNQNGVIFPIDSKVALVPSLTNPIPTVKLFNEPGAFPWCPFLIKDTKPFIHLEHLPEATRIREVENSDFDIKHTGLVLRRMFVLPPVGPTFWSRVICLCIQKNDFSAIVLECLDDKAQLIRGDHGLIYQIGYGFHMKWKYWRSGILLYLNDKIVLSINSLKSDGFTDPTEQSIISETSHKVEKFHFFNEQHGYVSLNSTFSEIIEVIVPEIQLESDGRRFYTVSLKLLAKALEIIDEVLKGSCDSLSFDGLYSIDQIHHVIPCPICFGDTDNRELLPVVSTAMIPPHSSTVGSTGLQLALKSMHKSRRVSVPETDYIQDYIVVFSIDQCIEASRGGSKYIECPKHKEIHLDYLAPDINFMDLPDMKLDVTSLIDPPGSDGTPVGRGCFGVVYHKLLQQKNGNVIHVAVKEFIVGEVSCDKDLECVKKYADMRYEINKLSMLKHDYAVKFIGLVTRPPSFVLEWAPLMSLEKIRQNHKKQQCLICPTSLYITLLQVLDGLHYLHAPPIGIIHSDLKLSNILAFRFPDVNHVCCNTIEDRGFCEVATPKQGICGVLVKLGDMGVCVNPAGHCTEDNLGVKRFAPECNNMREKKLTEKVDIFCLAICLYELLTLEGLPPRHFSEFEYRAKIAKGWRPLFHSHDTNYPLLLNLFLEQCWIQKYNLRPSALVLKDFLEGMTGFSVKKNFKVEDGTKCLSHCLDGYMLHSDDQEITAFYLVPSHQWPLLVYLGILEDGESKVLALEATEDYETKKTVLQTTVIHRSTEEIFTAICVTPLLDIMLGCQDGKIMYMNPKDGFLQTISGHHCNRDFNHGKVNSIDYVKEGDLVITGFTNGAVHVMKVQADSNNEIFLSKTYCCEIENSGPISTGCYVVVNHVIPNQLDLWCGCDHSEIEIWSFPFLEMPNGHKKLLNSTTSRISLCTPVSTPHSSMIVSMSVTPDCSSVFALIGDRATHGVAVICQVSTSTKQLLKHWQCQIEQVSYFSVTATDLLIGTATGYSLIYSRNAFETPDVYLATNKFRVLSHASEVSQILIIDGVVTSQGYTSMFNTYMGLQKQEMPCRFLVSLGRGFLSPSQFTIKALKHQANERDGYCINVFGFI